MSDLTDEDTAEDAGWCAVTDCVRPVTFHPGGLHLTIDGQEFDSAPSRQFRLRLIETVPDE